MQNATIATSRTRATADHLIDYRPLPASWGDVDVLRAVRARRARAAAQGMDPSTVGFAPDSADAFARPTGPARPAGSGRRAPRRRPQARHLRPRPALALFGGLRSA